MSTAQEAPERRPPTAKGEARRLRLLEIALDTFLEHGYAATSMQSIVRCAGGSATTAYQLFKNKEGLFAAVLEHELADLRERFFPASLMSLPPEQALADIADHLLAYSVQPRSVAVYRLLMTASYKLPDIPGYLREQVRAQIYQPLEDYLRAACGRGELQIDDTASAANMLGNLLYGLAHEARIVGGYADGPTEQEKALCRYSIQTFLRAYGSAPTACRAAAQAAVSNSQCQGS